ncbi:Protein GVQW1 [Plecturocebus cupreus]
MLASCARGARKLQAAFIILKKLQGKERKDSDSMYEARCYQHSAYWSYSFFLFLSLSFFLFQMGPHCVGETGIELLASSDCPTLASQRAGITNVAHCPWPLSYS